MAAPGYFRPGTSTVLTVNSAAGATASTASVSAQCQYVRLCYVGSVSSTGGCRVAIVDSGTVSSTAGILLVANIPEIFKITPGQRVVAISNDAGTFSLNIVELQ